MTSRLKRYIHDAMSRRQQFHITPRLVSRKGVAAMITRLEEDTATRYMLKFIPADAIDKHNIANSASITRELGSDEIVDENWEWLPDSALSSATGLAFVYANRNRSDGYEPRIAFAPPFPVRREVITDDFGPLYSIIDSDFHVGIILVRMGRASFGIAHDTRLVAAKTFTRYVRGRHRAGGQSANRFKRNRDKWASEFLDRAASAAAELLASHDHRIEWLAMGGDTHVMKPFLERTMLPDRLETRILQRRLPLARPGREALVQASRDAWSCAVFQRND